MFISDAEAMIFFIPFALGMVAAFFAAKKGGKGNEKFTSYTMSESLWYGYSLGNMVCILSFFILAIISFVISNLGYYGMGFGEFLGLFSFFLVGLVILSYVLGLILYLPCAFLGYNLYARKRAEEEIARTQKQIIKDIEAEKLSKDQLSEPKT